MKTLVLAKHYRCYDMWCQKNYLHPRRNAKFISRADQLLGYDPHTTTIVLVCDWTNHMTEVDVARITKELRRYEALGATIKSDWCT